MIILSNLTGSVMKYCIMRHFIWVVTVCQITHFGDSGLQRVNMKKLLNDKTEKWHAPSIGVDQPWHPYSLI